MIAVLVFVFCIVFTNGNQEHNESCGLKAVLFCVGCCSLFGKGLTSDAWSAPC